MKEIDELVEISRFYGGDSRYVIAGGGNTSYKTKYKLWVKASGYPLATISEDGFSVLDRTKLNLIAGKEYSSNAAEREEQVKNDLAEATITKDKRPSVETSMHNAISFKYVVHLHPTYVNAIMGSNNAEEQLKTLFGETHLYIPYTDPGYVLFKKVDDSVKKFKKKWGKEPSAIWLQNHGIFVGADTTEEIKLMYESITEKIDKALISHFPLKEIAPGSIVEKTVPAIRMMLSCNGLKTLKIRNNELIKYFYGSAEEYKKISKPFSPDAIVYCKSNYIYIDKEKPGEIIKAAKKKISDFKMKSGYLPKVILIKGIGLIAVGDNASQCDIILDVYEDAMKIAYLSDSFGGPHPMTNPQIKFIDTWEVENYRRSISSGKVSGRVENNTIIVTGAAQGFGEGIAGCLIKQGANIIVADMNDSVGIKTVEKFNKLAKSNRAVFVKTNVGEISSIENLIHEAICNFGAVDCFISNAGVLRAGGLDDMTPENFEFVTKINYSGYFYCTKVVSRVMKLQTEYAEASYYADIVQINSKSGLVGSKANFAYAGGKFGGIGLTQSFALELAPFRIKVNSVCPGNFYDGPLWSNPENGLFIQYLKAGKVPGAKTVQDVKEFYLAKVPMRKGCTPEDVCKGVMYLIDQSGETGQALPVTGGQVMLS